MIVYQAYLHVYAKLLVKPFVTQSQVVQHAPPEVRLIEVVASEQHLVYCRTSRVSICFKRFKYRH